MGRVVRFGVDGARGQGRPRFSRRGHAYKSDADKRWERRVRNAWPDGAPRFHGPVSVRIDVFRALPKGAPKRVDSEPDTHRPDADNVAKGVLDALNGVAWDDDAQVVDLYVVKHDRTHRERDLTVVTVAPI